MRKCFESRFSQRLSFQISEMSQGRHSNLGTVFFAAGFTVMLALDAALG